MTARMLRFKATRIPAKWYGRSSKKRERLEPQVGRARSLGVNFTAEAFSGRTRSFARRSQQRSQTVALQGTGIPVRIRKRGLDRIVDACGGHSKLTQSHLSAQ